MENLLDYYLYKNALLMKITTKKYNIDYFDINHQQGIETIIDKLDDQLGAVFVSRFEYPGRYSRWDVGFTNPPIYVWSLKRDVTIEALNERGKILLKYFVDHFNKTEYDFINTISSNDVTLEIKLNDIKENFSEEQRSKQPSPFSILRVILDLLSIASNLKTSNKQTVYGNPQIVEQPMTLRADISNQSTDSSQKSPLERLGFYGAFGYDLGLDFYNVERELKRKSKTPRDLALFIPDQITVVDHRRELVEVFEYEFEYNDLSTIDLARSGKKKNYQPDINVESTQDHNKGEYAKLVDFAKKSFAKGDLFEVNPSQLFIEPFLKKPSDLFKTMREKNPSPYGALINIGHDEWLVSASPEMYVRVENHFDSDNNQYKVVESAPIAGTVARGKDAISDYKNIMKLLSSTKEEAELTMCTDVDRNDKARICEPDSIQIVGRRLIELYSKLIHTVDHVKGTLRKEYDGIDAVLTHMWSVTMTGAPKLWAMRFIEANERNSRDWYAGAIGWLGINGEVNTGMTIRTVRLNNGRAEIRAGATLLHLCDPQSEEEETELKASAFIGIIKELNNPKILSENNNNKINITTDKNILFIDHEDSFVHMLASYFRSTGAHITTYSAKLFQENYTKILLEIKPDLIVLSPGPGNPDDFKMKQTIKIALENQIPIFGVCLGLQGLVEFFGGQLGQLKIPTHGISSQIQVSSRSKLFNSLPKNITVGRYHSLYADEKDFPSNDFEITMSINEENKIIPMAIEHKDLKIAAVQFHPESLMSLEENIGKEIINCVVNWK